MSAFYFNDGLPETVASASDRSLPDAVEVTIRLLNYAHLVAVYGDSVAGAVGDRLVEAVADILPGGSLLGRGALQVDGEVASLVCRVDGCSFDDDAPMLVSSLLLALGREPVVVGEHQVHLAPAIEVESPFTRTGRVADGLTSCDLVPPSAPFAGQPVDDTEEGRARYRRDMEVAARVFGELRRGELALAFQPIRLAGRDESLLYEECLLRSVEGSGVVRTLGFDIMVLERLGLTRVIDHHTCQLAINRLRVERGLRLGVNVSAQSACMDEWWSDVERQLLTDVDLASRLTIEITETASWPSVPAATEFAARMRSLGCSIALDDFGAGRDAIRNLYALQPDVVKIDASFVRQARGSNKGHAALKSFVGLARAIGGTVVAEGIETKADCEAAFRAGAHWQQGFYIEIPRLDATRDSLPAFEREPIATFGKRTSPPRPALAGFAPAYAAHSGAASEPLEHQGFALAWLRWPALIAAALWALIGGAAWLVWGGSS